MNFDDRMHDYESVDDVSRPPRTAAPPRTVAEAFARKAARLVERAADAITFAIVRYPLQTRLVIGGFFVISIVLALGHRAHAAANFTPPPLPTGPSLLQDEINVAYDLENTWGIFQKALDLAATLFATLAILSVMVAGVQYYISNQSIRGLGQLVLTRVLSLGIPFVIITTAPTLFPLVAIIGLHIADQVTGQTGAALNQMPLDTLPAPAQVQNALTDVFYNAWAGVGGYNQIPISPRSIVTEGVTIAWPLIQIWQQLSVNANTAAGANGTQLNNSAFQQQEMVLGFVLALAIGIIAMFTFIAVELILAYLQIYLVLPVAAFSLGFLGSPATRHFGAGYWNVVAQSLLRFVAVVFVIGFACVLGEKWDADFNNTELAILNAAKTNTLQDLGVLKLAISAFVVTGSLFTIVRALPSMFGAVLFGGPGAGAEGIASTEGSANMVGSRGSGGGQLTGRTVVPGGAQMPSRTGGVRGR